MGAGSEAGEWNPEQTGQHSHWLGSDWSTGAGRKFDGNGLGLFSGMSFFQNMHFCSSINSFHSVTLGWLELNSLCVCVQIQATGSWDSADSQSKAMLEIKQPFTSTLSHLHLQMLSHSHTQGHGRNNQVHGTSYTHTHTYSAQVDIFRYTEYPETCPPVNRSICPGITGRQWTSLWLLVTGATRNSARRRLVFLCHLDR